MADQALTKKKSAKKTSSRRIIIVATGSDTEVNEMFSEIETAARQDRREVGDYLMVKLLELRRGADGAWFGERTQPSLSFQE